MPRRNIQQQPNPAGTTPQQALVTPVSQPEVLLAVQMQNMVQSLHHECASIRQELGTAQGAISSLETRALTAETRLGRIRKFHYVAIGVIICLSALGAVLLPDVSTLKDMAADRQYAIRHAGHLHGPNGEELPAKEGSNNIAAPAAKPGI